MGFPTVDTGNPLILNISNPNGSGGARRVSTLESARHRRLAGSGPRIRLTVRNSVTTQSVGINAEVGIGEEQSPADLPLHALSSAGLDIAQAVIGLAGLIPAVGNVADGLNAGVSVARGRYQDAILDGASAVPGTGQATGAVMVGIRGKRAISSIWKRTTKGVVRDGHTVYRVYGGKAGPYGRSWTRTDPRTVDDFRDAAGLPDSNSGRFVIEGTLKNTNGVIAKRADPLHGNRGGLDEIVVPSAQSQIDIRRVSGANPEY